MVLSRKETTVAYRCPSCGAAVEGMAGVFTLTADMLRLKCPCGGSELTIVYTKEKKIRLTVPCYVCPRPHVYTISGNLFFDRELFSIPCNYSGMNIFFTGAPEAVRNAMQKEEEALREMLGEREFTDLSHNRGDGLFSDPQILDIVTFVIKDLNEEGAIRCRCEAGEGEYEVDILEDAVRVTCKKCGAKKDVPTDSTVSAHAFLSVDHLELT